MVKLVLCWPGISGYMAACWRALAARSEVDLLVIAFRTKGGGKYNEFEDDVVSGIACRLIEFEDRENSPLIAGIVREANPDVIYIPGWGRPAYKRLATSGEFRSARFMLGMDSPWRGTWRQRLARLRIGGFLRSMDCVLVPGERSWQAARNMGVPEERIRRCSLFAVDYALWSPLLAKRAALNGGWPKRFVYLGRYVPVKAIDVLVDACTLYRSRYDDPWTLTCCGMGPLEHLVNGAEGIDNLGFVQPDDLGAILLEQGVFINPARLDPWPLVVTEACAAGLPVIASEACGSVVELVRPYYNGLTFPTDNVEALAVSMGWMHEHHDRLPEMGKRSQVHAAAFSAEVWAERWVNIMSDLVRS